MKFTYKINENVDDWDDDLQSNIRKEVEIISHFSLYKNINSNHIEGCGDLYILNPLNIENNQESKNEKLIHLFASVM